MRSKGAAPGGAWAAKRTKGGSAPWPCLGTIKTSLAPHDGADHRRQGGGGDRAGCGCGAGRRAWFPARVGSGAGGRGPGQCGLCPQQGSCCRRRRHCRTDDSAAGRDRGGSAARRGGAVECGSVGGRDSGAAAAAGRHRPASRRGGDRSGERCRRVSSVERRRAGGRAAKVGAMHAAWGDAAAGRCRGAGFGGARAWCWGVRQLSAGRWRRCYWLPTPP